MFNLALRTSLSFAILICMTLFCFIMMATEARSETLPVLGETAGPFAGEGPYWADNEPVRVKIDPLLQGATVNPVFTLDVWFQNFTYQPEEATSLPDQYANGKRTPQAGHFHVYGTLLSDNVTDPDHPLFWNSTNLFLGAPAATLIEEGHVQFDVHLPETGLWQLRVDAQYDDHTPRISPHPQYFGATDSVTLTAIPVPEPSSLFLMGAAMVLLLTGRKPRKYRS